MRTVIRFGALGLLSAVVLGTWWLGSAAARRAVAVSIRPKVKVSGATPEQLAMVRWAVGRFEITGLGPPAVGIAFHGDRADCGNHLGYARLGNVDLCDTLVNAMSRRALLHEMSHVWLDQNVPADSRARFLDLRGLGSWNALTDPWELRGYEQGAEIVSWTIGERIITPQIPYGAPEDLNRALHALAGIDAKHVVEEMVAGSATAVMTEGLDDMDVLSRRIACVPDLSP